MNTVDPYRPPEGHVEDVVGPPSGGAPPAGRGTRLAAKVLDTLIIYVPFIPMFVMIFSEPDADPPAWPLLLGFVGILVVAGINIVLLAQNGQTMGKKALSIKIVRTDGSKAEIGRLLLLRVLATWALGIIPFFTIVDILFIFREDRRCIHDLIADTVVIAA